MEECRNMALDAAVEARRQQILSNCLLKLFGTTLVAISSLHIFKVIVGI
jgi:hypothetical protein